jgi:hypothetical protein
MTTILVTRHFGLDEQRQAAEAAFLELGTSGCGTPKNAG